MAALLILPSITVLLASRAQAQLQTLPRWAVVDFVDTSGKGKDVGMKAASAFATELSKLQKYDVESMESVSRTVSQMNLTSPVTDKTSLVRLGQELRVGTLVKGSVQDIAFEKQGGGTRARVAVRVEVMDVASALPVNGALVFGQSSLRAGEASEDVLLEDALADAAAKAVLSIQSQALPTATVLNTFDNVGLINQGSQSGFKTGQEVVVLRGREQVAVATLFDVQGDNAQIRVTRSLKGMRPGDVVRVVWNVENFKAGGKFSQGKGEIPVEKVRKKGSNSALVSLAIIVGLVIVLASSGKNDVGVRSFDAEATLYPTNAGVPAVRLSWARDMFHRSLNNNIQWQIFRSDVLGTPILVADRNASSAYDTTDIRGFSYQDGLTTTYNGTCNDPAATGTAVTNIAGVTPGRPYVYQIALVYQVSSLDLPSSNSSSTGGGGNTGGANGGTGGNTGGANGGTGGNTGGANGGGGNTGGDYCALITDKSASAGSATPLSRVNLVSPTPNQVVINYTPFTFGSAVNPAFPTTMRYVLQLSTSPGFPSGGLTYTSDPILRSDVTQLSINIPSRYPGDTFQQFLSDRFGATQEIWWRIGAAGAADVPGPVRDASGLRYVFSVSQLFRRPTPPPAN